MRTKPTLNELLRERDRLQGEAWENERLLGEWESDELRDLRTAARSALTYLEDAQRWQWRAEIGPHPEAAERIAEALTAARLALAAAVEW